MTNEDFGHNMRARALSLPENELRRRVDVLLEQCSREAEGAAPLTVRPVGPYLYVSEILFLLGVGEGAGYAALRDLMGKVGGLVETAEGDLSQAEFEARDRAAYDADPEGWIRDHTVDGIRPHIPRRAEDSCMCTFDTGHRPGCPVRSDDDAVRFADAFPSICTSGTCGVCGACMLKAEGL